MRYSRQVILIGEEGQKKLAKSKVTVIGTGGLGCPVLTYLTISGVGNIKFIDDDIVSKSNLNRQFLHDEDDIGKIKVQSAFEKLKKLNSEINLIPLNVNLNRSNAEEVLKDSDVFISCVDNIETRMIINEYAMKNNIPFIDGGINGFYGYFLGVIKDTACLECIDYGKTKINELIPVIGPTAGIIGSLQANMCIKIILGQARDIVGKLYQYDGNLMTLECVDLKINKKCKIHKMYGGRDE